MNKYSYFVLNGGNITFGTSQEGWEILTGAYLGS